jgi:hypothetical protein
MKIAICFSGEPRFVKECYESINKNLIDPNKHHDIDFFVHTWYSPEIENKVLYTSEVSSFSGVSLGKNVNYTINEIYSPVRMIEEPHKKFIKNLDWKKTAEKYFGGIDNEEFKSIKINNFYSFMYSNMRSLLLKKEYELENGFEYDYVIRMRFDNILDLPIVIEKFDKNIFHYQEMGQPDNMISDWINFSSSLNMDVYSSIFINFEKLMNLSLSKYEAFSPECLIREILDLNDIKSKGHNLGVKIPRNGKIYI